jgi:site-specific DNA recombinase
MAVAVYLRVSTEEQRERQSIETQREFAERYRQMYNLPVFRVYTDDGVSGTVPLERREEGGQILRDAKLRRFDQLLVYKLDRLGRDTRLILNAVDDLEKAGVRVRSMTEEFDTGTATGRLMLTMLSGFASHEREVIRERSVAGTLRVAEAGAWLGGIVPYGYRKVGENRTSHLVISNDPIPGMAMSEADVIRDIFRMGAVERNSCRVIAARLNTLGIPCAYVRDERLILRGKRRERTAGIWTPARVRWLIMNRTYSGVHEYGKRSRSGRALIRREAPAIVSEETWQKAQENLQSHFVFGVRDACHQYLLRGLIKCALCGKTYIGVANKRPNGKREFYYRCNGAHSPSIYSAGERCVNKALRGDYIEGQVWADVEAFLRDPGPVLAQLQAQLQTSVECSDQTRKQASRLEALIANKAAERNRIIGLYRRGRLNDAELDDQLEEIGREETALDAQLTELQHRLHGSAEIGPSLNCARALLAKLAERLDGTVTWEQKRRLIEVLVAGISVQTVEVDGARQVEITVTYRFSQPDQPMPLQVEQRHSPRRSVRIGDTQTIGDQIRHRRLAQKLLQRELAAQLGVTPSTIFNWESNRSKPDERLIAVVEKFLC